MLLLEAKEKFLQALYLMLSFNPILKTTDVSIAP